MFYGFDTVVFKNSSLAEAEQLDLWKRRCPTAEHNILSKDGELLIAARVFTSSTTR